MQFKAMDGRKCDVCGKLVLDAPGALNNQVGFIEFKQLLNINESMVKDLCSKECLITLIGTL